MACAKCDFYMPKDSTAALVLEGIRVIGIQSVKDATFTPGNADTRSSIL